MSASKTRSTTNRKQIPMPEDWLARLRQPPPHPGDVFKKQFREQQPTRISSAEAARRLGYTPYHWGQVELGRRSIRADGAVKLEQLTGVSAEFWMRMQMHYDLWHAYQAERRGELKVGTPFATKLPAPKV